MRLADIRVGMRVLLDEADAIFVVTEVDPDDLVYIEDPTGTIPGTAVPSTHLEPAPESDEQEDAEG